MKGFSLIELIIVMTLIAIVATFSITSLSNYQRDTQFGSIAETIVSQLRYAQSKSIAGEGSLTWGVHFDTSVSDQHFIAVFQGASYGAGTNIERTSFGDSARLVNITLNGGGNDVLFNRLTGLTSQYGTGASSRAVCVTHEADLSTCRKGIIVTANGQISLQ